MVRASPWASSFFMGRAFFVVSLVPIHREALGLQLVHVPATGALHVQIVVARRPGEQAGTCAAAGYGGRRSCGRPQLEGVEADHLINQPLVDGGEPRFER